MIALADPTDDIGSLLLVEDNDGDAEYIAALLADEHVDLIHVETLTAAAAMLEDRSVNAILLDLRLPDGLGIECVDTIREVAPEVPVIVLTGLDDQILALRCLAAGAQDYISKSELRSYNLTRVIRYAVVRTREAHERLRADSLEALLADVVNSSEDAIISGAADGVVTSWNKAAERIFGLSADEAIGRTIADVARAIDAGSEQAQRGVIARALSGAGAQAREVVRLQREGATVIVEIAAFGLRDDDGEIRHFGAICRDVTEEQEREEQLREQHEALLQRDQQMRALTARLNNVREDEQRRISREVHDELGQLLMGLRLNLHRIARHTADGEEPDGEQLEVRLAEANRLVDSTVEAIQRIAAELRPTALDFAGLTAAIKGEAIKFEDRTGIKVFYEVDDDLSPPAEVATAFFRIFQEMMTNVARHAQASKIWIAFGAQDGQWRLSVRDNGDGFAETPSRESSLGLLGMRERAAILNGTIGIETGERRGSTVTASIPQTGTGAAD